MGWGRCNDRKIGGYLSPSVSRLTASPQRAASLRTASGCHTSTGYTQAHRASTHEVMGNRGTLGDKPHKKKKRSSPSCTVARPRRQCPTRVSIHASNRRLGGRDCLQGSTPQRLPQATTATGRPCPSPARTHSQARTPPDRRKLTTRTRQPPRPPPCRALARPLACPPTRPPAHPLARPPAHPPARMSTCLSLRPPVRLPTRQPVHPRAQTHLHDPRQ